jgi:hypothetical protein
MRRRFLPLRIEDELNQRPEEEDNSHRAEGGEQVSNQLSGVHGACSSGSFQRLHAQRKEGVKILQARG